MKWRSLPVLPLYFVGAVLWLLAAFALIVADLLSGEDYSKELLKL